jgi:uncharacterized protein YfiM (DUF2279 family)
MKGVDWDSPPIPAGAPVSPRGREEEKAMDEKELYRQKHQAQLDEWKADVAKLRARAAGAKADAQIEINKHIKELEARMHDAGAKLSEMAAASEEAWDSAKKGMETTWEALKAGVSAAAAKLKE